MASVAEESPQAIAARHFARERRLFGGLLKDPARVLSDRRTWPDHLPHEIARETTWRWALRAHLTGTFDRDREQAADHFTVEWPLPVGRKALLDHAEWIREQGTQGYFGDPTCLYDLMPLAGDELAACILTTEIGLTWVEVFGLVTIVNDQESNQKAYTPADIAFRITGPDPASSQMQAFTRSAREWWYTFNKMKLGPRRPYGTTQRTPGDYRFAYQRVRERLGRPPRSQREYCEVAEIPIDTMKRNFSRWGMQWSAFRRQCSAD